MDRRVGLELDVGLDPGRRRVDDRHAREHVLAVDPVAQDRRSLGELDARVHALHLVRLRRAEDGHAVAAVDEDAARRR